MTELFLLPNFITELINLLFFLYFRLFCFHFSLLCSTFHLLDFSFGFEKCTLFITKNNRIFQLSETF